jgi:glutamate-1-semialdehyde 2,1-aminomutase
MRGEIASLIAPPERSRVVSGVVVGEVSTGGTLFANSLSMAAGRGALLELLTLGCVRAHGCARRANAVGLREAIARAGLRWSVAQVGGHAYYFFEPTPPSDAAGSRAADDPDLRALIRVFMANRGVWESGWWLGPTVSVAHDEPHVDRYVELFGEFLSEVT